MAVLFEGECMGRPINPEIGGKPLRVRWDMIVADGPHKGKRARYSGKFDEKNIKFTKRDMMLVGWKGKSSRTFVADVKTAADHAVPFTAEIARNTYDNGNVSEWTSAKFSGGAKPLEEPDRDGYESLDRWLAEAPEIGLASKDDVPF